MTDNNQNQTQSNNAEQDKNKPAPAVAQPPSQQPPVKVEPASTPEKKA